MSQPQNPHDQYHPTPRPSLSIDWETYAAMLEDSDMPLEDQKELIETLWSIVVMFVDMGFELDPVQQICGQADDPLSNSPPDVVSLIEREPAKKHQREEEV